MESILKQNQTLDLTVTPSSLAGDYKVNQCEGHAGCVPCQVRFPSCRGRPDGMNGYSGRPGSPWYVTCSQQRVQASSMCKQDGAVFIFDETRRECVKREEQPPVALPATSQRGPQTVSQQIGYRPQQSQPTYQQQRPANPQQQPTYQRVPTYQQRPTYQQVPTYQNGYQGYQAPQLQTGYQQQPAGYQPVSGNSARQQARPQYVWLK